MLSDLKLWVENEKYKYSYFHHTASLASEIYVYIFAEFVVVCQITKNRFFLSAIQIVSHWKYFLLLLLQR